MRGRTITAIGIAGTLVFAACGGSDEESSQQGASNTAPKTAKTGGDLTMLYNADVDNIDPGITYYVARSAMYTNFCQVPKKEPEICPSVSWAKDFADAETLLDPVFNGKNILDVDNSNFNLLNDKTANAQMDKAEVINDPAARAKAWGEADKTITNLAPGVPWLWDTQPLLHAEDVNGVINIANAHWDLTFTSIK